MDINTPEFMGYFLDFSVEVTGFSQFDLRGTGQTSLYFNTICGIIGSEMFGELLSIFRDSGVEPILVSPKLGPIARNIIKLWYIATWEELPAVWHDLFGASINDSTFIVDPYAYPEGLVWKTIGATPPAANPHGYGSWSLPPSVKMPKTA